MSGRILVLGAAGRLGRAAAEAFRDAGWSVDCQVRARSSRGIAAGTRLVEVDANDGPSIVEAARGVDVVLHALNPPYGLWPQLTPHFAEVAIGAARAAGATLVFPGNLYNFGSPLPAVIDEATPMRPTARKGVLRVEVEQRMRAAAAQGVRTIVLRAGDFFGGGTGSWFDRMIVKNARAGRITYPGPLDCLHAWAYLPDLARVIVRLAATRDTLPPYAEFCFPGHAATGRELVQAVMQAIGRPVSVTSPPWRLLRLLSPFVPVFRELVEISYLWHEPHRIDGGRLKAAINPIPQTPFATAIAAALDDLGLMAAPRTPGRR
jgi:nucleoside-diphosphate-sugar epimerase